MITKIIIFTDLDGTLLHPKTYSFEDAVPALELLKERGIPLVLCSSKTKSEIEVYRQRLNNGHPFITENGGGIFIPEDYFPFPVEGERTEGYRVVAIGTAYQKIRTVFSELRERLRVSVTGFGDLSAADIAALSGLPMNEAMLAKARDFDEPFIFENGETRREAFLKAVKDRGLHWTQGRFFHVLGDNDKGKAVRILTRLYEKAYGKITTIGLGDSFNDLPLLQAVDSPVLVRKEDGSYDSRVEVNGLVKSQGTGPTGWNEVVLKLLQS